MIFLVPVFIFLTVYTVIYQLYLYRQMRLSLTADPEAFASGGQRPVLPKENPLRRILKAFGFLANFKFSHSLAGKKAPSRLVMAGSPVSIVEFIILKFLAIAVFALVAPVIFPESRTIALAAGVAVGFLVPDLWLNLKVKKRHNEIRRDLPAVIDLLNLCVDAGLDFMLAVHRVIREFKKCAITDEFSEVWRETRMGASRRDALQHLTRRVGLSELSSFVRTLLQADRMGSPMGEALKIQAEEIRMRRYLRGEETALKAPIKLLFPLFLFILPAVLVVVAGPIFLQFMRGGVKLF